MEARPGGITAVLVTLRTDLEKFLESQIPQARSADAAQSFLWSGGAEAKPEPPAAYEFYKRLKLLSGNGPLMFVWPGGYLDQPWLLMQMLELCADAELEFEHRQLAGLKASLELKAGGSQFAQASQP